MSLTMTTQRAALESTFRDMGYASVEDFAVQKAREELLREKKISDDAIAAFEAKYRMKFSEFETCFPSLTQFSLFEREDDLMDWRAEVHVRSVVEERLARLSA